MAATSWSPASAGISRFAVVRPSRDISGNRDGETDAEDTAFAPLVFGDWCGLEGITEKQLLPARRELYSQNTPPDFVYFIETGLIKLVRLTDDGGESILGLRSNGWIIDAAAVVLNRPRASAAVTVTACTIRRARRSAFMQILNTSPGLMLDLNRMICREINADQEQQIELRSGSAQGRLERLVRELTKITHSEDPLRTLPLKKLEIAQLLSITPEHLSRLLRFREDHHAD